MILAVVKAIYAIACCGGRASDMMHCGLASTSPLGQLNEIPGTLRRGFAPCSSVVKCSWENIPALVRKLDFCASVERRSVTSCYHGSKISGSQQ